MTYILKQTNKDSWLNPKIEVITQESFDELLKYVSELNKPKLENAIKEMLLILDEAKQEYKTSIFKGIYNTKYPYMFEFYSTDYTTKKSRVSYQELDFLEKYGQIVDKINPYAKMFKTLKLNLTTKEKERFKHLESILNDLNSLSKPSWYKNGVFQGELENNDIESKITQAQSYALLFDDGYLDSNGYTNAHLSDAKLFSSIEVAKRSRSARGNNATIVKLNTKLEEVIFGHNDITDKITATIEKRRLEKMLELANIEELKKQIAEYEKSLNKTTESVVRKKVKI